MFLVGDPYKPSFATVTGRGDNPRYMFICQKKNNPQNESMVVSVDCFSPTVDGKVAVSINEKLLDQ